jgi:hypothetical protein
MVTGEPPFDGGTSKEIMMRRLTAPVPNAREMNPSVSEETTRIISRLMQKDPADRYQTPEALVKDLGALIEQSAAQAPRRDSVRVARSSGASSIRRPALPDRRNALFLAGGALLGVCVAAFVALLFSGGREEPEKRLADTSDAGQGKRAKSDAEGPRPAAEEVPDNGDSTVPKAPADKRSRKDTTKRKKPDEPKRKMIESGKKPGAKAASLRSMRMLIRQASRLWDPPMEAFDFRLARTSFDAHAARKGLNRKERSWLESYFERAIDARVSVLIADARALAKVGREEDGLRKLARAKFRESDAKKEWTRKIEGAASKIRERLRQRKEREEKERVAQAERNAALAFEDVMRTVHAHFAAGDIAKAKAALEAALVRRDLAAYVKRLRQEREAVGWLSELSLRVEAGVRKLRDGRAFRIMLKDGRIRDVGAAGGLRVSGLRKKQIELEKTGLITSVRLSSLSPKTLLELALLATKEDPGPQATVKAKWVYAECLRWGTGQARRPEAWKEIERRWLEAKKDGAAPEVLALVGGWMVRARNRMDVRETTPRVPADTETVQQGQPKPTRIPGLLEGDLSKPNVEALLATAVAVERKWGVKTFHSTRMTVPRGRLAANVDANGGLQRLYGLLIAKAEAVRDPLVAKLAFLGFRWAFAKHATGIFTQPANHELLARYAKENPERAAEIWADLLYCLLSESHARTHTVRVFEVLRKAGNSVPAVAPLRKAAYAMLRPRFAKAYKSAKGGPVRDRLYPALAYAFLDGRIDDGTWVEIIGGGPKGLSAGPMPVPWGIGAARMGSTEGLAVILNAIRSGISMPAHSAWLCRFECLAGISVSGQLRPEVSALSPANLKARASGYLKWLRANEQVLKWDPENGRFKLNGAHAPVFQKQTALPSLWKDKAYTPRAAKVGDWVRWQADRTWSDASTKERMTQVLSKATETSAEFEARWDRAGTERKDSRTWPMNKAFLPVILPAKLLKTHRCTDRSDETLRLGGQSYDCLRSRWERAQSGGGKDVYEIWTCPLVPLGGVVKSIHTVAGRRITTTLVSSGRGGESK